MADVAMPEALYVRPDGKIQIIQVPGPLRQPEYTAYYPPHHKGHLTCRFCDAAVHFKKGSPNIAGSELKGQSPHFATNPGQIHAADCEWEIARASEHKKKEFDIALGYRFHINTTVLPLVFNDESGLYHWNPEGHITSREPVIQKMEPVPVHSVKDVVDFMQRADNARLRKSVAIHRGQIIEWDQFLIRYSRGKNHKRHIKLLERLQDEEKPLCLIEFQTKKSSGLDP